MFVAPQAFNELVAETEGGVQALVKGINDVDLKAIGKPALPDDVNRVPSSKLNGPIVLQVVSINDISRPSYKHGSAGSERLLLAKLTDGKVTCKALEYQGKVEALHENLPPGTKCVVTGASIKNGVVQLTPKCIKVRQCGWAIQHTTPAGMCAAACPSHRRMHAPPTPPLPHALHDRPDATPTRNAAYLVRQACRLAHVLHGEKCAPAGAGRTRGAPGAGMGGATALRRCRATQRQWRGR